jgi:hypothetical protein
MRKNLLELIDHDQDGLWIVGKREHRCQYAVHPRVPQKKVLQLHSFTVLSAANAGLKMDSCNRLKTERIGWGQRVEWDRSLGRINAWCSPSLVAETQVFTCCQCLLQALPKPIPFTKSKRKRTLCAKVEEGTSRTAGKGSKAQSPSKSTLQTGATVTKGIFQAFIEHLGAHLKHQMCTFLRPLHLLLFGKPLNLAY